MNTKTIALIALAILALAALASPALGAIGTPTVSTACSYIRFDWPDGPGVDQGFGRAVINQYGGNVGWILEYTGTNADGTLVYEGWFWNAGNAQLVDAYIIRTINGQNYFFDVPIPGVTIDLSKQGECVWMPEQFKRAR